MMKVDDTLGVFSTHGIAGLTGGLLVGILANPDMLDTSAPKRRRPASALPACSTRHGKPASAAARRRGVHHIYNAIATLSSSR